MKKLSIAVFVLVVTGCSAFGSSNIENAVVDLCKPACAEVVSIGEQNCHNMCVTAMSDDRIPVEMTFVCGAACREVVKLGKSKCTDVCQDSVTKVFERIDEK